MSNFFILNYHTVLPQSGFDVSCRTLDLEFRYLKAFCDVVPLDEIRNFVVRGTQPKRTTVAITFDDGYLDTFVYAYPLCKKHGIRATVFPIASRIINDERIRPTLEDYWQGKVAYKDLYKTVTMSESNHEFLKTGFSQSFMSVAELRKAAEVMDIGSHAFVHAGVFYEDKITDIYDETNSNPTHIYAYEEAPVLGFPIFPDRNTISVRRGFLREDVKQYVRGIDKAFFTQKDWKELLREDLTKRFSNFLTFETEAEQQKRVEEEIIASIKRIEEIIGQKPRHFAYPYGQHDPVSEAIVAKYFDAAFTTHVDIVRMNHKLHLLPRAKVHRDIFSFIARVTKFSRKK